MGPERGDDAWDIAGSVGGATAQAFASIVPILLLLSILNLLPLIFQTIARFYERHGELGNANLVLHRGAAQAFPKPAEELSALTCAWAEMNFY